MTEPSPLEPMIEDGDLLPPEVDTDAPNVAVDERERPEDLQATGWPERDFQPPGTGPQLG